MNQGGAEYEVNKKPPGLDWIMKQDVDQLIAWTQKSEISSINSIMVKIVDAICCKDTSATDLKNIIESDPPLVSRILKKANSAYYGMTQKMGEVLDAIVCIGFEAVKELALSQTVCELFKLDDPIFNYSRPSLWKHSVAVALCGKLIYRHELRRTGNDMYVLGLLHDIGIIIEDQFSHEAFAMSLQIMEQNQWDLQRAEKEVMGYTHAEVGHRLALAWSFPELLCRMLALDDHVVPDNDADIAHMAWTLVVANNACRQRQVGYQETARPRMRLLEQGMQVIQLSRRGLDIIMQEVDDMILRMEAEGWF